MLKKILASLIISFLFFLSIQNMTVAQELNESIGELYNDEQEEKMLKVQIVESLEKGEVITMDYKNSYEIFKLVGIEKNNKDNEYTIRIDNDPLVKIHYKIGDRVYIKQMISFNNEARYVITDYVRQPQLYLLLFLFIALVVLIGKKWGVRSLVAMLFSFLIIVKLMLPLLIKGANPALISIIASLIIIPPSFYLSHGFNKKTHVAIAGTLVSLLITIFLIISFVKYSNLTGFASEEAGFLNVEQQGSLNIISLLIAGIIIGVLGVLDDITIAQSGYVFEIKKLNNKLNFNQLYKRAMKLGQDHISSMVNTLILVYTGASLPLLLLFLNSSQSFEVILNSEIVAEEIIRTLVSSIGLVIAAPITTLFACMSVRRRNR